MCAAQQRLANTTLKEKKSPKTIKRDERVIECDKNQKEKSYNYSKEMWVTYNGTYMVIIMYI